MRLLRLSVLSVTIVAFGGGICLADGFSLTGLSPFGNDDDDSSRRSSGSRGISSERPFRPGTRRSDEPSGWEKFQQGWRAFDMRTKKFFSDTADALTPPPPKVPDWLKPKPLFRPKKKVRPPYGYGYSRRQKKEKEESWFDGLFAPEEPPMPQSPEDFVGMDRPEM